MRPLTCAEVQELAAELALDLLTGPERAAALAHLAGCAACRAEVASLTDVGEAVLAIAPEVPPTAGFESRVIAGISAARDEEPRPVGPRPLAPVDDRGPVPPGVPGERGHRGLRDRPGAGGRRRILAAAAVVVAVAALAAALVVGRAGNGGNSDGGDLATADLRTATGRLVGQATLRDADPAVVTLDMGDWAEHLRRYGESAGHSYWLTVGTGDEAEEAYALPVGQRGPWHVGLDGDEGADAVTTVAVVDETGHTWCDARFTAD